LEKIGLTSEDEFVGDLPNLESIDSLEIVPNDVLKSIVASFLAFSLMSSSILGWTYTSINDGSVFDNSRWSRISDAYEEIAEADGTNVVFIGSSVFHYGIDGTCLDEQGDNENQHWNLAILGDTPYNRILELEMMKQLGADMIVLEAGPNTFQGGLGSAEARENRWQVLSLNNQLSISMEQREVILGSDMDLILDSNFERLDFVSQVSTSGLDELAHRMIYAGESRRDSNGDEMLPARGSSDWIPKLKSPNTNSQEERLTEDEFEEYLNYIKDGEFWKPELVNSANRRAFDLILEELEDAGVEVLLLSMPIHSELKTNLNPGWWDPFNETVEELSKDYHYIDLTWENWADENFYDPVHLSEVGRHNVCLGISDRIDISRVKNA